jgi:hypothetical protein
MRKALIFLVCAGVLAVPAVSVADQSTSSSLSSTIATETDTNVKRDTSGPASACKSQHNASHRQSHSADANAFGKCVSTIARHRAESDRGDSAKSPDKDSAERQGESSESHGKRDANPAVTCKGMQAHDPSAFQATYGGHPNAFGKCVSSHAHRTNG